MNKNSVGFFSEIIGRWDSIIEGDSNQPQVQPLASVISHTVDLKLGSNLWHENGSLDFEFVTAVGDPLGVVACAGCHHSPGFLFLGEVEESSACSSQLEAPNILQILSLDEHIGLIFFGEIVGLEHGRSFD